MGTDKVEKGQLGQTQHPERMELSVKSAEASTLKAPKDRETFMIITNIYGVFTMRPSPALST